jgi:hypothetical protein
MDRLIAGSNKETKYNNAKAAILDSTPLIIVFTLLLPSMRSHFILLPLIVMSVLLCMVTIEEATTLPFMRTTSDVYLMPFLATLPVLAINILPLLSQKVFITKA